MNQCPRRGGVIETRAASVWVDDQGYHQVRMKPVGRMTLADVQAIHEARLRLAQGSVDHLLIVDISARPHPTAEARAFAKSPEALALTRAAALIARSAVLRVVANAALRVLPTDYPMRLFADETSAREWLATLR